MVHIFLSASAAFVAVSETAVLLKQAFRMSRGVAWVGVVMVGTAVQAGASDEVCDPDVTPCSSEDDHPYKVSHCSLINSSGTFMTFSKGPLVKLRCGVHKICPHWEPTCVYNSTACFCFTHQALAAWCVHMNDQFH